MAMVFLWAYDLRKKLSGCNNKKHSYSKIFFEAEKFSTFLENKNSLERQKNLPPTVFFLWLFSFMFWLILTKEKNCRKFSFNKELKFRKKISSWVQKYFFVQNRVRNNKIFFSKGVGSVQTFLSLAVCHLIWPRGLGIGGLVYMFSPWCQIPTDVCSLAGSLRGNLLRQFGTIKKSELILTKIFIFCNWILSFLY